MTPLCGAIDFFLESMNSGHVKSRLLTWKYDHHTPHDVQRPGERSTRAGAIVQTKTKTARLRTDWGIEDNCFKYWLGLFFTVAVWWFTYWGRNFRGL